jgi:hypothetical protein
MSGTGRHALRARPQPLAQPQQQQPQQRPRATTRLAVTAAVAAVLAVGAMIGAVLAHPSGSVGTVTVKPGPAVPEPQKANVVPAVRGHKPPPVPHAAVSLVLTAADHRDCPTAATACVDLTRHITWLQDAGETTFGPVQMEPGQPGSQHQTPHGTFNVAWKAGPTFESNIYHEAMPWATFFAVGGIAFHGGSLTTWSHGCVHLTTANAHYYNEHLPIGAEVVVF